MSTSIWLYGRALGHYIQDDSGDLDISLAVWACPWTTFYIDL